jgi:hypothetical protein
MCNTVAYVVFSMYTFTATKFSIGEIPPYTVKLKMKYPFSVNINDPLDKAAVHIFLDKTES